MAVAAGAIVGLVASELALRAFGRPIDDIGKIRTPDRFLHHAFNRNATGLLSWGPRLVPYATNSLGYRDREPRDIKRFAEGARIVLLGDSFIEGLGVPYERTLASDLEAILRRAGSSMDVLNGAVASYSPFLYERRLRQFFAAGFHTDAVVVFLDISDIQDEAIADYEKLGTNGTFYSSPGLSLLDLVRKSRIAQQFWETVIFQSLEQRDHYYAVRERWTEDDALFEEYGRLGVTRCEQNLLKVRDLALANKSRVRLVIYPWQTQLSSQRVPSRAETIFTEFASRNSIPLTNAFPAFRSKPDWQSYFLPDDPHWNEKGHLLMADLVARDLVADLQGAQ